MKTKKIVDEVLDNAPEPVVEAPVEEVVEAPKAKTKGAVSVFDTNGTFIREYSAEAHGKEYADLAKQFAIKKGYSLK